MAQYVLIGTAPHGADRHGAGVDPRAVLFGALAELGREPDLVVTSHADVDHCGGNAAIRARFPGTRFACHAADRAWIESSAAMLAGNYLWYGHYGFGPSAQDRAFLEAELGSDTPVDDELSDGDVLDLGDGWMLRSCTSRATRPAISASGTRGRGSAIVIDAMLDRGVRDRAGTLLIPPRIYDTVGLRRDDRPDRGARAGAAADRALPVLEGADVDAFLARSRCWNEEVAAAVRDGATTPTCGR